MKAEYETTARVKLVREYKACWLKHHYRSLNEVLDTDLKGIEEYCR